MITQEEYIRIQELRPKIEYKTATNAEIKEYMDILLRNNNITQKQYDDYFSRDDFKEHLLHMAFLIGGIVLLGYLITNNK